MTQTLARAFFALIPFATLLACSGGVVNVGASDPISIRATDGGPTGDGAKCSSSDAVFSNAKTGKSGKAPSGATYSVGQTFPSPDGCNTCTCTDSGISCTEEGCISCLHGGTIYAVGAKFKDPAGCNICTCENDGSISCPEVACPPVCSYEGKIYNVGESFPSIDGCNTCHCGSNLLVSCTEKACAACPAPLEPAPGTSCGGVEVWSRNPTSGACCNYASPCHAPAGWKQFGTEVDCKK